MKIITKADFRGQDPVQALQLLHQRVEMKVMTALKQGVQAVKRHLVVMTETRLTKRSGALLSDVKGAQVLVGGGGTLLTGELSVSGLRTNRRGQRTAQYIGTHFGTGAKTIHAKNGQMLAIPIQGGPAWKSTAPTATPKDMPGIMVRIGQVLFAGKGRSRNLEPAFVLRPSVTIPRRINPQDAVEEAQMEILEGFRGMVGSVGK
jgi:hypothetical protein